MAEAVVRFAPKRHIVWFHDREVNLADPGERLRYYEQVLTHGRAEDVAELHPEVIRDLLPAMRLPAEVRKLWEDWFGGRRG